MSTTERIRINREIRAPKLRVIGAEGENLGVIDADEALRKAQEAGLDLIEISPNAVPPVAKIMDYGKFQYEQKKRESAARAKVKVSETKEVQIKVGTGENDMRLKAKKAAEWLAEGHRVRVELIVHRRDSAAAVCTVYAQAQDHSTVGERQVAVPAGGPEERRVKAVITTERRAVNGVLRRCEPSSE